MNRVLLIVFSISSLNPLFAQEPGAGWTFNPQNDAFSEDAILDLRFLNEDEAGQSGFIGLSEDGECFVDGNGVPIRFWASGGAGLSENLSSIELSYYARFLAKRGVNIIRYHAEISPDESETDFNIPNMEEIDNIWRAVAAFKKEGIYVVISPHWPYAIENPPVEWGFGEYTGNGTAKPWGALYISETYQEAMKSWVSVLYGETNPYTGIALKDDPSVAIIQMLNEDGIFFWTINSLANWPDQMAIMENLFYSWLISKYGTIESAYAAWNNDTNPNDNINNQRMGIENIWVATLSVDDPNLPGDVSQVRISDQIQFMAEQQRSVYEEFYDHYKVTLGCKQLINTTNWKTASSLYLNDAERWTNAAADVVAVNRYVSPTHVNPNNAGYDGYRIDPGDYYIGESVLKNPNKLPISSKQVDGHPFIVTESGWNLPAKYQAEGPWLIAAYSSLNGVDAFFWFNPSHQGFDDNPYYDFWREYENINTYPMFRWTSSIPGTTALYPASAYIFRKGLIQESDPVVLEQRPLQSIWDRELPVIAEENGFDPNRDSYGNQNDPTETEVIPFAFLTGKVKVAYGGDGNTVIDAQINTLVDLGNKTIGSSTGELKLDYGKGLATMSAPMAQGATGFFSDGESTQDVELPDITLSVKNEYAAISVVSMEDTPLGNSGKILVQIGTVYRPTGWVEQPAQFEPSSGDVRDGFQIINTGRMPWKAANNMMSIEFRNQNIKSAHLLTANGEKSDEILLFPINDGVKMYVPSNAMYIMLSIDEPNLIAGTETKNSLWSVYPNPSDSQISIRLDKKLRGQVDELEIMDIQGRSQLKMKLQKDDRVEINPTGMPRGVYLLILKKGGKAFDQRKLILE